jgi:hypothetical protein
MKIIDITEIEGVADILNMLVIINIMDILSDSAL